MATGSDAMSNGFYAYLSITETSTDSVANTSVVSYSLWIDPPGNWESYNLTASNQSYSITINGSVVASGNFTYDFRSPNNNTNKTIKTGTVTISHNSDGSKTVAASATVNTSSSTVGDASIASFNTVLTDFVLVPSAPASINTTRTSRNVEVVSGSSTGPNITGYFVQYSTDGGSSWSTAETMVSQVYTYTNLTAGATYLFRVYSSNSDGNSAYTTSASVLIPAGGKRWDGSTFVSTTTAKRWDGSSWLDVTTAKRWDGSSWVDLS